MKRVRALMLALCCAGAPVYAHDARAPDSQAAAAYELGRSYRNGDGVARDAVRALRSFERAAALGHPAAMFTLSNMLAAGEGCARDDGAARHWLEAAAELEYPEALQQMALHLQHGSLGYTRDERRAEQLLAVMGHAMKHRSP